MRDEVATDTLRSECTDASGYQTTKLIKTQQTTVQIIAMLGGKLSRNTRSKRTHNNLMTACGLECFSLRHCTKRRKYPLVTN